MSDEPQNTREDPILLDIGHVLCPAHGEHLRAKWPAGYLLSSIAVFQAAIGEPALMEACGWRPHHAEPCPIERVNPVIERKPLCYFLDPERLREVLLDAWVEAGVLSDRKCALCGFKRAAGPYTMTLGDGSVATNVVCLRCAIQIGSRWHAHYPDGGWQQGD